MFFVCKPYFKHWFSSNENYTDLKHKIHKWTAGIILVEHIEPDGKMASEHHKDYILFKLF